MAIQVECGDCGKTYNVKDEMDGKKIRCKACSAVIVIRAQDDWGDEEEFQAPVRKTAKKKKRATEFGGRPLTVWIALGCLGMMGAIGLYGLLMVATMDIPGIPQNQVAVAKSLLLVMVGFILLIQLSVFVGLLKRSSGFRTGGMVLAGLASCMMLLSFMKHLAPDGDTSTLLTLTFGLTLRVTFIGCLLTPSAVRHFNQ